MRNLILLILLIIGVWFYLHSQVETKVDPPPVVAAVPPPTPNPRLYYHSPLDAPPMSTSNHTGTGYYSTDPKSQFGTGSHVDEQRQAPASH